MIFTCGCARWEFLQTIEFFRYSPLDTVAKVLLVVAPTLFWVVYYLPWNGDENWFPIIAMAYIAPVCLVLLLPTFGFAIWRKRDISWWLVLAYVSAPVFKTGFDFLLASGCSFKE